MLGDTDKLLARTDPSIDQYKDSTYNPPSTSQELANTCMRITSQFSSDPQGQLFG
jgi:hypothetical protein